MQTTLESLDQLTRRLNVAVPIAQIEGEVQKRLARLAKTAKVAGFRPGKVPLKMVAQQYGQQVRSDVISDAVNESFNDAVRAQNLRVAGYPRIERRDDASPSQEALRPMISPGPQPLPSSRRPKARRSMGTGIIRPLSASRKTRTRLPQSRTAAMVPVIVSWGMLPPVSLVGRREGGR